MVNYVLIWKSMHILMNISRFVLTDVDECAAEIHDCHFNATCKNIDASFSCECYLGFSGDGISCKGAIISPLQCIDTVSRHLLKADVDECAEDAHNCHFNASCINDEGSYLCECGVGYSGDGLNCDG